MESYRTVKEKDRILLVDDHKFILETYGKHLEMIGYDVETAMSGKDTLSKGSSNHFDLGVIDKRLPWYDDGKDPSSTVGWEVAQKLGFPKIMWTDYPHDEDLGKAKESGILYFICKGITSTEEIDRVIKESIAKSRNKVPCVEREKGVLIMMKEYADRDRIGNILKGIGYSSIAEAGDAGKAYDAFRSAECPGKIIADSDMPGVMEFLQYVKGKDRMIPVILKAGIENYTPLDDNILLFDCVLPDDFEDIELQRYADELDHEDNGLMIPTVDPIGKGEFGTNFYLGGIYAVGKDTSAIIVAKTMPSVRMLSRYMTGREPRDSEGGSWRVLTNDEFDRYIAVGERLKEYLRKKGITKQEYMKSRKVCDPERMRYIIDQLSLSADKNMRVCTDVPVPYETDWIIAGSHDIFDVPIPADSYGVGVCLMADMATSVKRQFKRPFDDRSRRILDVDRAIRRCFWMIEEKGYKHMICTDDMTKDDYASIVREHLAEGRIPPNPEITPKQLINDSNNKKRMAAKLGWIVKDVRETRSQADNWP